MKKLHLIKETISKLGNLEHIKAGERQHPTVTNTNTSYTPATTNTLYVSCPVTSGRPVEGRKTKG
ncbi:hypothetical protein H2O64_13355 [Kordia sp. YSTF-M3]|uniref:Uncharacterized protein n=1 Tax=Kordia aestuariivivens TaxID=2759037 RepID=A0ABR7QBF5_9FLAO|nr:hypothetical protein [Kordia aestuariivivens]MBC8755659.1 hypothetical protein [Kordia aestuariivivens]